MHKKCSRGYMCMTCYDSMWLSYEERLKEYYEFDAEAWIRAGENYNDYPAKPCMPKCTTCLEEFRGRNDIVTFLDWDNGRERAQRNRESSDPAVRKAQEKRDKKNKKQRESRNRREAKKK